MLRRLREMLEARANSSTIASRVFPAVLAVAALLIFVWVLTGALSGGSGSEQAANRSSLAQAPGDSQNSSSSQNSGASGGAEAPVPQSENKNVDSYAAYTSKDPFRQLVKPAGGDTSGSGGTSGGGSTNSGSGSGTGGGSTNTASGGGGSTSSPNGNPGGNANGGSSQANGNNTNGSSTANGGVGAGKGKAAARKRAVQKRAARMRRAAVAQARRQARAQAARGGAQNGLPNSGGRLPDTGGMLSGGYK